MHFLKAKLSFYDASNTKKVSRNSSLKLAPRAVSNKIVSLVINFLLGEIFIVLLWQFSDVFQEIRMFENLKSCHAGLKE